MGKYTAIDDPSAHFQAFTYTGIQTNQSITLDGNSDLQPDLYWYKARNTNYHYLVDSSRGTTKYIYPNDTLVEGTVASSYVTSFDSNGVTLGGGDSGTNTGGVSFANWAWKANGGTTSSNTDGNITSTVQSNQDAGFSLVTYTGNGSNNQTIGHGLGVQPSWWIVKRRDSTGDWWFGASSILGGTSNYLKLNSNAANAEINNIWGDSPTSSTLFRVSNNAGLNASGGTYVAYLFANKQGYSKFGKYVGNSSADGPFVYTGFKPAFLIVKKTTAAGADWRILDSARNPFNLTDLLLSANTTNAEFDGSTHASNIGVDFLSNGFKVRTTYAHYNGANDFIYIAFAENPFVTSTGIMGTAR